MNDDALKEGFRAARRAEESPDATTQRLERLLAGTMAHSEQEALHTELTERAPDDMKMFLALVPNRHREMDNVEAAMAELSDFHERHGFRGHIVMIGDVGITEDQIGKLQDKLQGSTLVTVPV